MRTNRAKQYTADEMKISFTQCMICACVIGGVGLALILTERPFMGLAARFGGILCLICAVGVSLYGAFTFSARKKRLFRYMQNYSFCVDSVTRTALSNFVHPMAVLNMDGEIIWSNERFLDMIGRESHYGEYIQDIFSSLPVSKYLESDVEVIDDFDYGDRNYIIHGRAIRDLTSNTYLAGLYFIDVTETRTLRRDFEAGKCVQCQVVIDNYDEVMKETPNANHGAMIGEIERIVNAWVEHGLGVVRRYEREKFIVFFRSKEYGEIIEKEKFKVLADVRNINLENKIPVTLSIGVGLGGENLDDNNKMANLALEMALGRGGDQVVVKTPSSYKFYGAKSREVEKSTKVKARVMAHALREAIDQSSSVIIMGHKSSDMDCVGAAIGLCRAIKSRGQEVYIAIRRNTSNAKLLLSGFLNDPNYEETFVSAEKALTLMDKQSLVIVVDTHRHSMVEFDELLHATKSIVLIDHHRRAEDFIDNAVLKYHEPYASSACEMVTEILQYIQDNPKIGIKEAEALYAGIYLDTKGFTFKTGVRTFEAAAYLRRMGVDPVHVRRLFKNDITESVRLSKLIGAAKIYRGNIAISVCTDTGKDTRVIAAKAADELLNISGIEASFVVAKVGSKIIISGRSLEKINVQVILERLGGGGHITIAGAQLTGKDLDAAVTELKRAIDDVIDDK